MSDGQGVPIWSYAMLHLNCILEKTSASQQRFLSRIYSKLVLPNERPRNAVVSRAYVCMRLCKCVCVCLECVYHSCMRSELSNAVLLVLRVCLCFFFPRVRPRSPLARARSCPARLYRVYSNVPPRDRPFRSTDARSRESESSQP